MSTKLKTEAPPGAFPSGDSRPIAVLAAEPSALARRFGLRFTEGLDDLDRFRFSIVDLGHDRQAWFYKHHGDPNPGTVVQVDSGIDPVVARRELAARFSLGDDDVLWWSPES